MKDGPKFYIDGKWTGPAEGGDFHDVIDPSTETVTCRLALGSAVDAGLAIAAAKQAFPAYSATTTSYRREMLQRVLEIYDRRTDELANAVSLEMGSPAPLAKFAHVAAGRAHLTMMIGALDSYKFERPEGSASILREPIGVCALITPWNWPLNQVAAKVMPALAAGCTMVLKPSEFAPFSVQILAEILHEAKVPAGVFNLVYGIGTVVGEALSSHPDVDMVSFTGSTRAGISVAKAAADSVKRVTQELGGKSANLVLDDADLHKAINEGIASMMLNSGQSCNAPSRMLIPKSKRDAVIPMVLRACQEITTGPAFAEGTTMGPVVNAAQWEKIQRLIQTGIAEGATLVTGGAGKPEHCEAGYFVSPTVFIDVKNDMTIAREEIFGPVLVILTYEDEEDAITLANDTIYGLAAYVQSSDPKRARRVAGRLRAGNVYLNGAMIDVAVPFGGYKHSGNGREWGLAGLEEYLETKAILGT